MAMSSNATQPVWPFHVVGGAVCALLWASGYLFGIAPLDSGGESQGDQLAAVREAEQRAALQDAVTQRLSQELSGIEAELSARPMQLLQSTYANRRVAELSELAHAYGLTLESTQPGTETMMAYYAFVPVEVGGEGRLNDFVEFMGALHRRFPDMGVQAFEVVRDPTGGGRFTLALNWFVEPTQTAEAS
ncbi:MAG: type 4a pilus biogenesis protein PilO [Planctomycetota bacterium]